MHLHLDYSVHLNRFTKYFVLTDFLMLTGWGFLGPVFALFVVNSGQIAGATVVTVGIATALYWVIKSIIQVPIANFLDKTDGEKDDFYALFFGLLIIGVAAFLYLAATKTWHIYTIHVIQAIGYSLYVPAWSGLFTRHLEKERSSLGWTLDNTIVGLSSGIAGLLGSIMVEYFGFQFIFIVVGLFSFAAAAVVMIAPSMLIPRVATKSNILLKDHSPRH